MTRVAFVTLSLLGMCMLPATAGSKIPYPATRTDNVVDVLHGTEIVDPYRWLEDGNSSETKAWVDAQNKFTQTQLSQYPGREKIRKRLEELLTIGSLSAPTPAKGRYFFTRREGEQNQPVLYVREGVEGKERVLLDINALAKDGTIALDWYFPSKDGKLLAYGLSKDGSERSVLHVRDVDTGKDLADRIENTRACSVAWWPDSSGFFYTRYPKKGEVPEGKENYFRHVFSHTLGVDPTKDPKVFGEGRQPEDWPSVALSPNGRWLAVSVSQGWAKTEVYLRDNQAKTPKFVPLVEGVTSLFSVTLRNDRVYVKTNQDAPRYRLFSVDPMKLGREHWQEILPEGLDVLENVAVIGDRLITEYMVDASSRIRLFDLHGKNRVDLPLPTLGTVSAFSGEWDGKEFYYGFHSFTVAPSVYRVELGADAKAALWGQVKTDLSPEQFQIEQVKYRSKDGTMVPMFLAYKKGMQRNGKNATLLYGYGGFNISLTPVFSSTRFLFLEAGGVLAIANLRGGGEYGESWHKAGMLDKKQNTFDDFLAAGEWLIEQKYTDRAHLAIQGGSNGGLLMGAALTQRPDLFKACVCQVPLIDMTRFHKFLIARLWIPEYGNPDDPKHFAWIEKYSPYQKVKKGTEYPALLVTTAASDSRVDPLHARKFAARVQAASTSNRPVLLRQETRAGHGAGKPRNLILDEQADVWTFLFSQLGL